MESTEEVIMIEIGNTLVSLDLAEKKFCCDLAACKGGCCVAGDSGAPVTDAEIEQLQVQHPAILPYLRPEGASAIALTDVYYIDDEHDKVTTLIKGGECAYTIVDADDITKCAIEAAFLDGKCSIRKPISCYLYPVRINKHRTFDAVNYDQWSICKAARAKGEQIGLPVYKFLKEPLTLHYGAEWYEELDGIVEQLAEENS